MTEFTDAERQVGRVAVALVTEGVRGVRADLEHLDVAVLDSLLQQFAEDLDDDEDALGVVMGRITLTLGIIVGAFATQLVHDERHHDVDADELLQRWALRYA